MLRRVSVFLCLMVSLIGLTSFAHAQLRQSTAMMLCGKESYANVTIVYQYQKATKIVANTCQPGLEALYPFQLPEADYAKNGVLEMITATVTVSHTTDTLSTGCTEIHSGAGVWGTIDLNCQLHVPYDVNGGYGAYFYTAVTP